MNDFRTPALPALDLTLEQKQRLLALLPTYPDKGNGRPRADTAQVFLGILWVLVSGARWEDLDKRRFASRRVPPGRCQRSFAEWVKTGVFEKALLALARQREDEGLLKLHESFIDGTFVEAKKGVKRSV